MIIGLCGYIGSGKGTVASILEKKYGFAELSFAGTLKDVLAVVFGWDRNQLEGITVQSRHWRTQVDTFWEKELGIPGFTPRMAMQKVGTELFRNHFSEGIWVSCVKNQIANLQAKGHSRIVISDCRFKNEIDAVKFFPESCVLEVVRSSRPVWHNAVTKFNQTGSKDEEYLFLEHEIDQVHQSERDWVGYRVDGIIDNTQCISSLHEHVEELVLKKFPNIHKQSFL